LTDLNPLPTILQNLAVLFTVPTGRRGYWFSSVPPGKTESASHYATAASI